MSKNKNLYPIIKELHKAFDLFNKTFYNNELPEVIIAIRSQGKRNSMGWFTPQKTWKVGEDERHEIVITAEVLDWDFMETMDTLHHEMIHLYCEHNGIKDTSRSGHYHNTKFRDESLKRGFEYAEDKPDSSIGWSYSRITDETKKTIESWDLNKDIFNIARKSYGNASSTASKSNIVKWTCPSCGDIIRSSKPVIKAYCMNDEDAEGIEKEPCGVMFEPEV